MGVIEGIVVSGFGEGFYFMSLAHYKREIKNKLGFESFPGTLNIKVNNEQLELLKNKIIINGFELAGKKFGSVNCYKAKISDIDGAIIIPKISKHGKDIIEFIAPVKIKEELRIKDGNKVKIELNQ